MQSYTPSKCSACGKSPRPQADGVLKALQRCSRCQHAWYHDADCQKQHYPHHKKECRDHHTANQRKQSTQLTASLNIQKPQFRIERRAGRGNCLVAYQNLSKRTKLRSETMSSSSAKWKSLASPVLHESQRPHRCAYCFGYLPAAQHSFRYQQCPRISQYQQLFCSRSCMGKGSEHYLELECKAIAQLYAATGPPMLLSSALFLFRILCAIHYSASSTLISNELEKLHHHDADGHNNNDESAHHKYAVASTVFVLLHQEPGFVSEHSKIKKYLSMQALLALVGKINVNGFTITDGEFMPLGVAVFPTMSAMNHSCAPNAIQTFQYGRQSQPTLLVTLSKDTPSGEEICIAYTNTKCPNFVRRETLLKNYNFLCNCAMCTNDELGVRIIGLLCPHCNSNTPLSYTITDEGTGFPSFNMCQQCKSTDFSKEIALLKDYPEQIESGLTITGLQALHGKLNGMLLPTSWYIQDCLEDLAKAYLEALSASADNARLQQEYGEHALIVLDQLINSASSSRNVGSEEISHCLLIFKAEKLRLFLRPDPREAISKLQKIHGILLSYLGQDHELMAELEASLRGP